MLELYLVRLHFKATLGLHTHVDSKYSPSTLLEITRLYRELL